MRVDSCDALLRALAQVVHQGEYRGRYNVVTSLSCSPPSHPFISLILASLFLLALQGSIFLAAVLKDLSYDSTTAELWPHYC